MNLIDATIYALFAVNLAAVFATIQHVEGSTETWWFRQLGILIFGSLSTAAEPGVVWGITLLALAAVIGLVLVVHTRLRPFTWPGPWTPFGTSW